MSHQVVHVWHAQLDVDPGLVATLEAVLSDDERDRAGRFLFDRHRRRYVVARGLLRTILGRWLELSPQELKFGVGVHGKPYLTPANGGSTPCFNVAHSDDHALIAVTTASPVGIDIEMVREVPDALRIAERFFSPREAEAIRRLPPPHRRLAFFRCWTRKEAYIKALGTGLSQPLGEFDVTVEAGAPPLLTLAAGTGAGATGWSLADLSKLPAYAAALAVQAADARVQSQEWEGLPSPR